MWKHLLSVCVLLIIESCATPPIKGDPNNVVLVDTSEPAYTLFIAVSPQHLAQLKESVPAQIEIVHWQQFLAATDRYVASRIIEDEYPGSGAVEGIIELLEKYPGMLFSITWNGGIAFTKNEYEYAKSTYITYTTDAADYERTRIKDPLADPVNPSEHLGSLLEW